MSGFSAKFGPCLWGWLVLSISLAWKNCLAQFAMPIQNSKRWERNGKENITLKQHRYYSQHRKNASFFSHTALWSGCYQFHDCFGQQHLVAGLGALDALEKARIYAIHGWWSCQPTLVSNEFQQVHQIVQLLCQFVSILQKFSCACWIGWSQPLSQILLSSS